jgi:hypothetical protein
MILGIWGSHSSVTFQVFQDVAPSKFVIVTNILRDCQAFNMLVSIYQLTWHDIPEDLNPPIQNTFQCDQAL